ncbi:MAG: histidine kinase N-terminal 7TM domain-containing protein [Sporomusaceae bacterium]|nr:histidine kinase N-terminal 7TM domain-containing protein [Sporomusaceae bacterium]
MDLVYYSAKAYIPFTLFVIGALIALATYTWQFRSLPGVKSQVGGQLCRGAWLLFMVFTGLSDPSDKLLWVSLGECMSYFSSCFWFAFVLEMSQQENRFWRFAKRGYFLLGLLMTVAIFSNPWHEQYWQTIAVIDDIVMATAGPIFSIAAPLSYTFCLVTLSLGFRWILRTTGLRRRQAWWFSCSGFFSLIGIILDNIPECQPLAPMPLGFLLSSSFVTWGFYRWQTYAILPVAQQVAVRNMIDGLIVVDEYGYIADRNTAAQDILQGLAANIGDSFNDMISSWPALAEAINNSEQPVHEVQRERLGQVFYYEFHKVRLQSNGHYLGMVFLFKDITKQKMDQYKMLEQERALSILQERERLRRELHDGPGQIWSYLKLEQESAIDLIAAGKTVKAKSVLEKLVKTVDMLHNDVREAINGLKTATAKQGFFPALKEFLSWYEETYSIETRLLIPEDLIVSFTPKEELQLLRIIQEAMTNARKHARTASIEVSFIVQNGRITITVADDGCGFSLEERPQAQGGRHQGLVIMQERAGDLGGRLEIESEQGLGTKVRIHLPQNQRSA